MGIPPGACAFVDFATRDYNALMSRCHPVLIASALALAALAVSGCGKKSDAAPKLADVTAGEHGFEPTSLKLTGGAPGTRTTVSFVRTTDKTCATEVVFPDLKIEQKLPLNEVVKVDLPIDTPRTLAFQCGMGMYKGAIVVSAK
jgi:plastocyanin domain-containing protein